MQKLYDKLTLNWYCTHPEPCRRRACINPFNGVCPYLEARTTRQLAGEAADQSPEMREAAAAYRKLERGGKP